jgi:hypothetical protein
VNDFYDEAVAAFRSGENIRTRELSEEAIEQARAAGDRPTEVEALCMLARVALREGDLNHVRALAEEARLVARATGDPREERMPLHMQAGGSSHGT